MKIVTKIVSSIVLIFIMVSTAYAQVPQGFNFQAVATAPDGTPISNQEIGVQIEVVKGTEEGTVVYTETHSVTTNAAGLFQIVIGEGTPAESNDFSTVNWGDDNYFVGFGIDLANTGSFESLGKTRLLSVPYALLAQDVVNGGGTGEIVTELNLDATVDTAFTVTITGDEGLVNNSAIIGEASTFGTNVGVEGKAYSQSGSDAFQVGTYGEVSGEGTGTHIAVFGSAINDEGTGGRRYGLYGQARSSGRENIGGFGVGLGPGDGEIVLRGDEFAGGDFNVGGFNIGMVGFARQNLNGNIGVRGYVYGENGARSNRALQAEARTTADGTNIGLQALVSGSFSENIGIEVDVYDETDARNLGTVLNVGGSSVSNVGLIVNADTAAMLNGQTVINGDLTVNGFINGGSGGGGAITEYFLDATVDTAFQVTISGDDGPVNNSAFIGLANTSGTNVGVEGKGHSETGNERAQFGLYGEAIGEGTGRHYGVLGWAASPDRTGGNAYGLYGRADSQGKFNFGTFTYVTGIGSNEIVPLGDPEEENGNFGTFNIGYGTYVEGNANGNTGLDIAVGGDQGSRINIGAEARVFTTSAAENSGIQAIVNGSTTQNRGFWGLVNGDNNNVGMELIVEGGTDNRGIVVNADIAATFNGAVEINQNAIDVVGDTNDDQLVKIQGGGINAGINPYTDGIVMNHNTGGGSVFEMYKSGANTVLITGDGNATFAGTVNQASDLHLKTNITDLSDALNNTLALRGVSYTWIDENKTQDTQIGVIAQEVEEVYPEFVRTDDEGMKSVNYSQMVAVLIEAVKELNSKIEALESENSELRAQLDEIDTMKAQINTLMTLISATPEVETVTADK